jgi:hemerythrin-like domain-containing protein
MRVRKGVMEPDFEAIRQEHQQVLDAVRRLETSYGPDLSAGAAAAVVGAFLEFFRTAIEPHMRREEAEVYPLLQRYLPEDIGSASAMLREHETLHSLVGLLQQACHRLAANDVASVAAASTLAQDVALLLRDHIRKEDSVINPLLERILRSAHV